MGLTAENRLKVLFAVKDAASVNITICFIGMFLWTAHFVLNRLWFFANQPNHKGYVLLVPVNYRSQLITSYLVET